MGYVSYGQSGYVGCSMSENAYEAYSNGEMPLSYWKKERIIEEVILYQEEFKFDTITEEELKPFLKKTLQDILLIRSSWHHTSKFANETDFYYLNEENLCLNKNELLQQLKECEEFNRRLDEKKRKKTEIKKIKAKISYEEWEGSRNYGKFIPYEKYCIRIGKWAFLKDGRKKDLDGTHIKIIETYTKAPRGTAKIFKEILKNLPKKYK